MEDFWNELSQQEKEEIELGIKLLDEGYGVSYKDFREKLCTSEKPGCTVSLNTGGNNIKSSTKFSE